MYLPKRFENENLEDAFALIQKNDMDKELAEMMARSWKAYNDKRT